MSKKIIHALMATLTLMTGSTLLAASNDNTSPPFLPVPKSVEMLSGNLVLNSSTSVSMGAGIDKVGQHFIKRLQTGTGWNVKRSSKRGTIHLSLNKTIGESPEAYAIKVSSLGVNIVAVSEVGIARAVETLFQMMPADVYKESKIQKISLPHLIVKDEPRLAWRGFMLDVSRHFMVKDDVIKYLNGLAASKINTFQWHLTDDQGWRLPIAGYPKLTSDASKSYSREDIQEIVEHAVKLGITIVPEIDIPGHCHAACKAYPEIASTNRHGKRGSPMDPSSAATYKFLDAVFADVVKQFPNSPYIHIGADEVGTGNWNTPACKALMKKEGLKNAHELYVYFVNRAADLVVKLGRKPVAWEEAYSKESSKHFTFMGWRGMRACLDMPKDGRPTVMAPGNQIYFDHANSRSSSNNPGYGNNTSNLNVVYFFEAQTPALSKNEWKNVLGAQACLWGERIRSPKHQFQMGFPRIAALSESTWANSEQRNWDDFLTRLKVMRERYDAMGIPYFWETDALAVSLGDWKAGYLEKNEGVIDIPLKGKIKQAGLHEFSAFYHSGYGMFQVTCMEVIGEDDKVISRNVHDYAVSANAANSKREHFYKLTVPDTETDYTLRIHAKQVHGECSAVVQMIPALKEDRYHERMGPDANCNGPGAQSKSLTTGKPTTASKSVNGMTPNKACDANTGSRWSSGGTDKAWISVDLGIVYQINTVSINWEDAHAKKYDIEVSLDGSSWTKVYTGKGKKGKTDAKFDITSAKHVKIICKDPAFKQWGFSIREIKIQESE